MKVEVKDLKLIIPVVVMIIGSSFSAGVFIQDKFIGADRVRDAVETCNTDLKETASELKLAEKYIIYLEADSQFYRMQTIENYNLSNEKKLQLEKQLSTYSKKTKKKSLIDRFSQLKTMQNEQGLTPQNLTPKDLNPPAINMRIR